MTLKFDGKTIPGTSGPLQMGSPIGRVARATFAGVNGEAEIALGGAGRDIAIEHVLHDEYKSAKRVWAYLKKLDEWAVWRTIGTLKIDGDVPITEKECVFVGYQSIALPGQSRPGMLEDHAGTLDGGWFITLLLQWRQLIVKK
jgi:hypothetical protein